MTKNLFQPGEIKNDSKEFQLKLVHDYNASLEEEVVEEAPVYTGPTVEELQKAADDFKAKWEIEKQQMMDEAKAKAEEIIKNAEAAAFEQVKQQSDKAQIIKAEAESEAREIVQKAQDEANKIIQMTQNEQLGLKESAYKDGFDKGRDEGFETGQMEVKRLVERTHRIMESVMTRREEILNETEQQIVELVILISRKVIKVLSENQRNVVMANVLQALKRVKGRGNVQIHVNLSDLKLTTEHIQDFIKQVENIQGITVLEDSSVEQGGCIVETDFGAIDARISSQLTELENKILEISPVKTIMKADAIDSES